MEKALLLKTLKHYYDTADDLMRQKVITKEEFQELQRDWLGFKSSINNNYKYYDAISAISLKHSSISFKVIILQILNVISILFRIIPYLFLRKTGFGIMSNKISSNKRRKALEVFCQSIDNQLFDMKVIQTS